MRGQDVAKHLKAVVMTERLHSTLRDKGYYQMRKGVENRESKDQSCVNLPEHDPAASMPPYEPPSAEERALLPGNVSLKPALPVQPQPVIQSKTGPEKLLRERQLACERQRNKRARDKGKPKSNRKKSKPQQSISAPAVAIAVAPHSDAAVSPAVPSAVELVDLDAVMQ
jgi:hypothetical protein